MKFVTKIFLALLFIAFISCRDTAKEEAELNAEIEEVEDIETEIETISEEVESNADELEESLKELDSL
jgi:hypothetical protein